MKFQWSTFFQSTYGKMMTALVIATTIFFLTYCGEPKSQTQTYLNHDTTVTYVGKETCRGCHQNIYGTFVETGMGRSFGYASKQKSSGDFNRIKPIYDKVRNLYYLPYWVADSFFVKEFRLSGKDTVHQRIEKVHYIIGSGQHTNSHFTNINGYVYQLPFTWYTQLHQWDLPPGFENGRNVRFNRAIGMECMSCHNALPEVNEKAFNQFVNVPDGIDCERCHGPGSLHVKEKLAGKVIDTSTSIDYTIVNPRKLSWELQIDVCQRCHLQGNAILKEGKHFKDFRPGMKLSDVVDVFMPVYKGNDQSFIMASHAERLQKSACFIQSNANSKAIQGQTFQRMNLTCITCHNPHVSVKVTGRAVFNNACIACHQQKKCTESETKRMVQNNDCASCHMPRSGTQDIPHVSIHDHWIRKPVKANAQQEVKRFIGLYCVNNKYASFEARAEAYLNYVERFEGEVVSFDSAHQLILQLKDRAMAVRLLIHEAFLEKNYHEVARLALGLQSAKVTDAWTCYRVGEAMQQINEGVQATSWFKQAVRLAPGNLEFLNKLGSNEIQNSDFLEGIKHLKESLLLQNKQEDTWVNLGFGYAQTNELKLAIDCYNQAIKLNPDHLQGLLNRAALLHQLGSDQHAKRDLLQLLKKDPHNEQVKQLLKVVS